MSFSNAKNQDKIIANPNNNPLIHYFGNKKKDHVRCYFFIFYSLNGVDEPLFI